MLILFAGAFLTDRLRNKRSLAAKLRQAGLESIRGEHYEGGHWLGSFALYLVSRRGLQ